eukprot:3238393-Pyramimonas_sp.AAC.1
MDSSRTGRSCGSSMGSDNDVEVMSTKKSRSLPGTPASVPYLASERQISSPVFSLTRRMARPPMCWWPLQPRMRTVSGPS